MDKHAAIMISFRSCFSSLFGLFNLFDSLAILIAEAAGLRAPKMYQRLVLIELICWRADSLLVVVPRNDWMAILYALRLVKGNTSFGLYFHFIHWDHILFVFHSKPFYFFPLCILYLLVQLLFSNILLAFHFYLDIDPWCYVDLGKVLLVFIHLFWRLI